MLKYLAAAGAALTLTAAAASASAAIIIPVSTSRGSFVVDTLSAGDDLRNNHDYSSANTAYGLFEGVDGGGLSSILLHYDRSGGIFSAGRVSGVFQLQLANNETLANIITNSFGLLNSDPNNGVTYQRSLDGLEAGVTLLRGLEPGALPGFGDYINLVDNGNNLYTISYDFRNDGLSQDQVRFQISSVSAVPEPATWAMMIGGFGLAGVAIRRRRSILATA
jgi:hypothetical protein